MPSPRSVRTPSAWWQRTGLGYTGTDLSLAGHSLVALGRQHGTPLYVYDGARIRENLQRLKSALDRTGLRTRVFYAMKSNRFPPLLGWLHQLGGCGVDTCSPAEVRHARAAGFSPDHISFTGTSLSDADWRELVRHDGLILNVDSLHDLTRLAALAPGRRVGLRINPGLGIGYRRNQRLRYAGGGGTKFGIHREQFALALRRARASGLVIEGLHFHTGCGFLTPQLPVLDQIFKACMWFVRQVPNLRYLNVGGGLGIPLVPGDRPLDLDAWSARVARHFGKLGCELWCEPGDYLVKDAGVLLLEVNTVETKGRTRYAGVNGGFSIHLEPAFYQLPLWPVPVRKPRAGGRLETVTLAGNINEALDLLHRDAQLPPLRNGDLLAFLNAGGYGSAMASNHCLRGTFAEAFLPAEGEP